MKKADKKDSRVISTRYEISIRKFQDFEDKTTYIGGSGVDEPTEEIVYRNTDREVYSQSRDGEIDLKAIIDVFNK